MKRIIAILLFIIISYQASAQRMFDNDRSYNIFRNYTHWGVQVEPLLFFPATFSPQPTNNFKSQYGLGYKAGLIYNLSLSNHLGFRFGALLGQVPVFNTYFVLNKNEISENMDYFHKKGAIYSPLNYSIPIMIEYRMFMIERYVLNLSAGTQIEYVSNANLQEAYKQYYLTRMPAVSSWNFDLVVKAGWYFQFKKALMLQTNIVYKYRFNNQYTGSYYFDKLNAANNSKGSVIQKSCRRINP